MDIVTSATLKVPKMVKGRILNVKKSRTHPQRSLSTRFPNAPVIRRAMAILKGLEDFFLISISDIITIAKMETKIRRRLASSNRLKAAPVLYTGIIERRPPANESEVSSKKQENMITLVIWSMRNIAAHIKKISID